VNQEETVNLGLKQIGLTPRLINATEEKIPEEVRQALPASRTTGFGLIGTAGAGKSCAIACRVRRTVTDYTKKYFEHFGLTDYDPRGSYDTRHALSGERVYQEINWLYWPDSAQVLQESARTGEVPKGLNARHDPRCLKSCKILILDDLGRERYGSETYACAVLESVLNHRYEHGLRTLWTSNLNGPELLEKYATPTMDRLCALAPVNGYLKRDSLR